MEKTPILSKLSAITNKWVFVILWLLTFALYIPTARAGWVIDAAGFLYNLKHQNFWDYINRAGSSDQSFYQVLTLHYYIFYKLWKLNFWLWSLLYITVHAVNALLIFIIVRTILADAGITRSAIIPLAGVLIYTISPHISEVLIGRAYYHYLQSFFFILLILYCVQQYQHAQRAIYVLLAALLFILLSLTLEIFYLTPFFVLALALYYRYALNYGKSVFRRTVVYFLLPQVLLLGIYFIALILTYKHLKPHKIELNQSLTDYLSKVPEYIFHIVFLGRYFPVAVKDAVYTASRSVPLLVIFYALIVSVFAYVIWRFKTISLYGKTIFLFFVLSIINLGFLTALPFPASELLVFYDRYIYFSAAFIYILLALIVARYIKNRYVLIGLFCIYVDINLLFTIEVNTDWITSDEINTQLIHHFPNDERKTVLLLNIPENMNGAPMIGAQPESMFKVMREIYTDSMIKNKVYDVASYNMIEKFNGAHVKVINDSVIDVMLDRSGTWWWYEGHGIHNYETPDYRVSLPPKDPHYLLTLKHPADQYLLLYSAGGEWKKVDMNKKNERQD